jgi:hypothetical protein
VAKKSALVFQSIFLENACLGHGAGSRGVTKGEEKTLRGGDSNVIGFIATSKAVDK